MKRQTTHDEGFIGLRCSKDIAERLRRVSRQRGWTMSRFVLEALDAAFAAQDRGAR
jgi:hypothetical protein